MDYLEAAIDLGVPAPLEAEVLSCGVVGSLEGVTTVQVPGEDEVPGVVEHVVAGLQDRLSQLPVRVHVLHLAGARRAEGVVDGDLVGGIEGDGAIEGRAVVAPSVGVGQVHRLLHQTHRIHELEPNILR